MNNININNSNFNNTIKLLDNDDEDNIYNNSNYQNIYFLDNKQNRNNMDIDDMSENNSNIREIFINNNSNEIKTDDNFMTFNKNNQNKKDSQMDLSKKQSSPLLNSFDSKIEISNTNNIIYKDNFLSPINNEISPIIKNLNTKDSNEKNKFNDNGKINNPFKDLNALIQKNEQEFYEKYGEKPDNHTIKNIKIKLNKTKM